MPKRLKQFATTGAYLDQMPRRDVRLLRRDEHEARQHGKKNVFSKRLADLIAAEIKKRKAAK